MCQAKAHGEAEVEEMRKKAQSNDKMISWLNKQLTTLQLQGGALSSGGIKAQHQQHTGSQHGGALAPMPTTPGESSAPSGRAYEAAHPGANASRQHAHAHSARRPAAASKDLVWRAASASSVSPKAAATARPPEHARSPMKQHPTATGAAAARAARYGPLLATPESLCHT